MPRAKVLKVRGLLELVFFLLKAGTGTIEEHGRLGLGRDQVPVEIEQVPQLGSYFLMTK